MFIIPHNITYNLVFIIVNNYWINTSYKEDTTYFWINCVLKICRTHDNLINNSTFRWNYNYKANALNQHYWPCVDYFNNDLIASRRYEFADPFHKPGDQTRNDNNHPNIEQKGQRVGVVNPFLFLSRHRNCFRPKFSSQVFQSRKSLGFRLKQGKKPSSLTNSKLRYVGSQNRLRMFSGI